MKTRLFLFLFLFFILLFPLVESATIILDNRTGSVLGDTGMELSQSTDDKGTCQTVCLGGSAGEYSGAYMFEIDALDSTEIVSIDGVALGLYATINNIDTGETVLVTAHHIYNYPAYNISGSIWNEGNACSTSDGSCSGNEMCYGVRPLPPSQMNATYEDSIEIIKTTPTSAWYYWDVTQMYKTDYNQNHNNLSIRMNTTNIFGAPAVDDYMCFATKEGASGNDKTPRLEVNVTLNRTVETFNFNVYNDINWYLIPSGSGQATFENNVMTINGNGGNVPQHNVGFRPNQTGANLTNWYIKFTLNETLNETGGDRGEIYIKRNNTEPNGGFQGNMKCFMENASGNADLVCDVSYVGTRACTDSNVTYSRTVNGHVNPLTYIIRNNNGTVSYWVNDSSGHSGWLACAPANSAYYDNLDTGYDVAVLTPKYGEWQYDNIEFCDEDVWDEPSLSCYVAEAGSNAPVLSNFKPANNTQAIAGTTEIILNVTYTDANSDEGTVVFYNASDDSILCTNSSVATGTTLHCLWSGFINNTYHQWTANASDC